MTSLHSTVPDEQHWAIIRVTSITVPGDERSRTHPGHGYPEHTETVISYKAFTVYAEWEREVIRLTRHGEVFRAIRAEPAKVSVQVVVGI